MTKKIAHITCTLFITTILMHEIISNTFKCIQNSNINKSQKQYDIISTIGATSLLSVAAMNAYKVGAYIDKFSYYKFSTIIAISHTSTFILKHIVHKQRPDKSDYKSFPSGHAELTAVSVLFLFKRIKNIKLKIFYIIAGIAVCVLRILAMRHDLIDVTCGIFIAALSSILVEKYLTKYIKLINRYIKI